MNGTLSAVCGECKWSFALSSLHEGENACPGCAAPFTVRLYPAARRGHEASAGEAIQEAGESACFFHADKRAAAACGHCGRFVCALCAIDFAGATRCAACLERGAKAEGVAGPAQDRFTNHDTLALMLGLLPLALAVAVFPIFFYWLTGPLAISWAVLSWRKPLSPLHRGRWRSVLALLCGLAQLVGFAWVVHSLFSSAGRR